MRNPVRRVTATVALAVLIAGFGITASGAAPGSARTPLEVTYGDAGDGACTMWYNSSGFGGYCGGGGWTGKAISPPPTWGDLLKIYQSWTNSSGPFIPCRDFPVPVGIELPAPPEGTTYGLRVEIKNYQMDQVGGGTPHLERRIVPLTDADRHDCREMPYMEYFWNKFDSNYPAPELIIKPTYTPRVNIPAYFALTAASSWVIEKSLMGYNGHDGLRMRALVQKLRINPGDGTKPFDCLMGQDPIGSDGYDETRDPFHQDNTCKHVFKRSSANQPDQMYKLHLTVFWEVAYWKQGVGWRTLGVSEVNAIQRLPVQEVQSVGG
jgi:hypothetical protein